MTNRLSMFVDINRRLKKDSLSVTFEHSGEKKKNRFNQTKEKRNDNRKSIESLMELNLLDV